MHNGKRENVDDGVCEAPWQRENQRAAVEKRTALAKTFRGGCILPLIDDCLQRVSGWSGGRLWWLAAAVCDRARPAPTDVILAYAGFTGIHVSKAVGFSGGLSAKQQTGEFPKLYSESCSIGHHPRLHPRRSPTTAPKFRQPRPEVLPKCVLFTSHTGNRASASPCAMLPSPRLPWQQWWISANRHRAVRPRGCPSTCAS